MVFDSSGNLYGTTAQGGNGGCFNGTCGVVFELTPGSGGWAESTLHTFTGGSDGGNPFDGLIFDASGNLYGTAQVGGVSCGQSFGCGVAFELTPVLGDWTETVLHSFQGNEGYYPIVAHAFDKQGHLYSTLPQGGSGATGTVYELSKGTGGWTERTLHSFKTGGDGCEPNAPLVLDAAGNLYGTTSACGNQSGGTVFELLHGSWKEKTLYQFKCPTNGCRSGGDDPRKRRDGCFNSSTA